jgi:hypothetical protein
MSLGMTRPLAGMSTRNIPGFRRQPALKADNIIAVYEPTVYKMLQPRCLTTLCASRACYWDSFTLFFLFVLRTYDSVPSYYGVCLVTNAGFPSVNKHGPLKLICSMYWINIEVTFNFNFRFNCVFVQGF